MSARGVYAFCSVHLVSLFYSFQQDTEVFWQLVFRHGVTQQGRNKGRMFRLMWFNKRSGFKSGKGIEKSLYPGVDCKGSFSLQAQ